MTLLLLLLVVLVFEDYIGGIYVIVIFYYSYALVFVSLDGGGVCRGGFCVGGCDTAD